MSDIFQAAGEGNLARVEELVAQGVDLAAFYPYAAWGKLTALFSAAQGGHRDVTEALIRVGAPLNVADEDVSPLHGAVGGSHHDLAAMLLREGAEVDSNSSINITPLSWAQDRRMAALLIAAGADVNASRSSPLHIAATYGRLEALQELVSHPDVNVNKQYHHRTPLHEAAAGHQPECVAALLAAGADACISDEEGHTPLRLCSTHYAGNSAFRIIAMLVAAGDRQWAHVPFFCPGLEAALFPVWKEAPDELSQLAARLHPGVKRRIQAALCTLHHASPHHLPEAICMRLLDEAFNV